jgi:hypothetical protein
MPSTTIADTARPIRSITRAASSPKWYPASATAALQARLDGASQATNQP